MGSMLVGVTRVFLARPWVSPSKALASVGLGRPLHSAKPSVAWIAQAFHSEPQVQCQSREADLARQKLHWMAVQRSLANKTILATSFAFAHLGQVKMRCGGRLVGLVVFRRSARAPSPSVARSLGIPPRLRHPGHPRCCKLVGLRSKLPRLRLSLSPAVKFFLSIIILISSCLL